MARAASEDLIRTAEDVFLAYLRERGLKYTGERRKVLQAVMRNDDHFEAEQLLLNMRQTHARVGKATVYRTLKLLVDCHIIREVHFSNKQVHYEHIYGQEPHDHLVCRRCGRIIEFDAAEVVRLRTMISAERGFVPISHRFQIIGMCESCEPLKPSEAASVGE
jgi:Fur family transcriptional regulator, ferric uptake regulator